jgi:ribosomal-protein-serine acetyltransferase
MLDQDLATGLGEPVRLRRLTTADADAFAAHVARDLDHLGEHLPWPAETSTPEGAATWLARYEHQVDGRVVCGGAFRGGELLGGALLMQHDPAQGNVELGTWVVTAGEGRGVATAACRALLVHARRTLGAERVEWRATTANHRSRRLADKLGFVHEGTLRANYVLRGARLDTEVLGLVGAEIDAAIA